MEALAKQFGYSKSRFSHLFNEALGCPPSAFINALRCQHAARTMLESDQPLLEIAMNAGFAVGQGAAFLCTKILILRDFLRFLFC